MSRHDRGLVFHGSSNVATFGRHDVKIQRRDVTEKVKVKNFQQFSKCCENPLNENLIPSHF